MSCALSKELLSAYIDNELTSAEANQVRDHLRKCPECVRDLKDLQNLVKTVHGWPVLTAPVEATRKVREELNVLQGNRVLPFARRRWIAPAVAVAAAALIAVSVVVVIVPSSRNEHGPLPAPQVALKENPKAAPLHQKELPSRGEESATPPSPVAPAAREDDRMAKAEKREPNMRSLEYQPVVKEAEKLKMARESLEKKPAANKGVGRLEGADQPMAPAKPAELGSGYAGGVATPSAPVILTVTSVDFRQDSAKITETLSRLRIQNPNIWVNLQSAPGKDSDGKGSAPAPTQFISVECTPHELASLQQQLAESMQDRLRTRSQSDPIVRDVVSNYAPLLARLAAPSPGHGPDAQGVLAKADASPKEKMYEEQKKLESAEGAKVKDETSDAERTKNRPASASGGKLDLAAKGAAPAEDEAKKHASQESGQGQQADKLEEKTVESLQREHRGKDPAADSVARPRDEKKQKGEMFDKSLDALSPRQPVLIILIQQSVK